MIVYHQKNVAAFKGAHVHYWQTQPLIEAYKVSKTTAAAAVTLAAQWRSTHRRIQSRVFGRVN